MKAVAFFDFDGTLTRNDTLISFARHALGRRRLTWALVKSLPSIALWKLGMRSNSEAKESLFGHLYRGERLEDMEYKARAFADEIDRNLREDTMASVRRHLERGDRVAIVSASPGFWIRPWALRHGIAEVIATEAQVDGDGRLTGRFDTPNCYGIEKEIRIRAAYPEIGQYTVYAYGDSRGDDAMLALADYPTRIK